MREHRVAAFTCLFAIAAMFAHATHAAPPFEIRRDRKTSTRAAPIVVPSTCQEAGPSTLSAQALLSELKKMQFRVEDLRKAEEALTKERVALEMERRSLSSERELVAAERIDVDVEREDLRGIVPGTSQGTPKANTKTPPRAEEISKLSGTVKAMKPELAAPVISKLEPALAAEVLRALSKPAAAAVLERIPPELAADLMARLAQRPTTDTESGS